jgi:anti-sigma-K factor RskA
MDDEDLDALAAEYVLGTLASDERAHAEALIAIDPGFVEILRQWERRLGELNVMVEAVEPPADVWDKVKAQVADVAASEPVTLAPTEPPPIAPQAETETKAKANTNTKTGSDALLGALASLSTSDAQAGRKTQASLQTVPSAGLAQPPSPLAPPKVERGAEVFVLARRVRRWRGLAVASGALAAVLAALIVVSQVDPRLIPAGGFHVHVPQLFARLAAPTAPDAGAAQSGGRLVAVLQQQPSPPAFLLTIDPASGTMIVRRVAAKEETGHSFELWLIAPRSTKPLSLGIVGGGEYTQRPLPASFDVDAIRAATYAVSFEPAGGSKTGAPTGPILFTGKLVESVPSQTPKT